MTPSNDPDPTTNTGPASRASLRGQDESHARDAESVLESLMAEYLQRLEDGEAPDPAEYLAKHPEHANELKSFFQNHQWLHQTPDCPPADLTGRTIGPYKIETEIARGGMGVVYRATQTGLGRVVALKLISSGVLAGAEERKRFRNEAEAASRLQHPGIVPIHEIGTWEGHEYFSMTLVEGPTLEAWVQETKQLLEEASPPSRSFSQVAETLRDVARAVDYAHQQGVIHRDLKPENILLDEGKRPMVTDFGLAKWHREGTIITRTGQVLGTPNYMSPEQAAGFNDGDIRVDVYALGAMLYALLAGRPPHDGPSVAEVLRSVLQDEPVGLRILCRDVPPELDAICSKALRFTPDDRYPTASDLADDLDRYLCGEELVAHHSGLVDVVAREFHRDQHQETFQHWGRVLRWIGNVILCTHIAIFVLTRLEMPNWLAYWAPRSIMLATLFFIIRWSRNGNVLPRTVAERPIWSIWIGYLATLGTMNGLLWFGVQDHTVLFPIASALSGFGFIAMAGHIWGGSAVLGIGFLLIAIVTKVMPVTSPLWFGAMWFVAMQTLGRRYTQKQV